MIGTDSPTLGTLTLGVEVVVFGSEHVVLVIIEHHDNVSSFHLSPVRVEFVNETMDSQQTFCTYVEEIFFAERSENSNRLRKTIKFAYEVNDELYTKLTSI